MEDAKEEEVEKGATVKRGGVEINKYEVKG
jgi:hypothetical protein